MTLLLKQADVPISPYRYGQKNVSNSKIIFVMNRYTQKVPWWFPDGKGLAYCMVWACVAVAVLSLSRYVQGTSNAVTFLGFAFSALIYWIISILLKYSHVLLRDASVAFLEQWGHYLVVFAFSLPIFVSWAENEELKAAWSPIDYWREEAKEAADQNCKVEYEWLTSSAEEVQVAENKLSMGIATSRELMDKWSEFKIVRDTHKSCVADLNARRLRAATRLEKLQGS